MQWFQLASSLPMKGKRKGEERKKQKKQESLKREALRKEKVQTFIILGKVVYLGSFNRRSAVITVGVVTSRSSVPLSVSLVIAIV
jgi:hypothetical protein